MLTRYEKRYLSDHHVRNLILDELFIVVYVYSCVPKTLMGVSTINLLMGPDVVTGVTKPLGAQIP